MTRTAVITGIGLVLPNTQNLDDLWDGQLERRRYVAPLSERLAGSVVGKEWRSDMIPARLWKKLDSFTRYAMVATQRAMDDAAFEMPSVEPDRVGVFVGNCFGGWQSTEVELRNLHVRGPRHVSPFQATSWFPAAPQGQISIHHGIKGYSKTYMADRSSSLLSVSAAADMIRRDKLDVAIAGGTESTDTAFVQAALEGLSPEDGLGWGFLPLQGKHDTFATSEGAVFLILEDLGRAQRRRARIYAEVGAFAMRNAPCECDRYGKDPSALTRSMLAVLDEQRPDVVLPDACGLRASDQAELEALLRACPGVPVVTPKATYGHAFGAEGALDIACACMMLQKNAMLPGLLLDKNGTSSWSSGGNVQSALINACATGGAASSLLLTKGEN